MNNHHFRWILGCFSIFTLTMALSEAGIISNGYLIILGVAPVFIAVFSCIIIDIYHEKKSDSKKEHKK